MPMNCNAVNLLRLVWLAAILWYELGTFYHKARNCSWPDAQLYDTANPTHVLLVADPQILDHRSYHRGALLGFLTQLFVDLNLRKNWAVAIHKKPDAVVFLGDMMDGGRFNMPDDEYEQYFRRFQHIFKLPPHTPAYFIPGNHDIGLTSSASFSPQADARFQSHFGPLNRIVTIANHTLVLLDAPTLVEEDQERTEQEQSYQSWKPIVGGPVEFVKTKTRAIHGKPVILLSHIPLAREDTNCGPLREKGTLHPGRGFGYENTLGREVTDFLLHELRPSVIFSGDDHDYCEHHHPIATPDGRTSVREVSVKSLSMAMGIRRPGFQLLSLASQEQNRVQVTHADVPCSLPDQLGIYLSVYLPLILFSILVVLLLNSVRVCCVRHQSGPKDKYEGDIGANYQFMPQPVSAFRNSNRQLIWGPSCHPQRSLRFLCFRGKYRKSRQQSYIASSMQDIARTATFPLILFSLISIWTFL